VVTVISGQSRREMSNAALAQWLLRLESIHPREIELGLERVATVARKLALLPVLPPVITVGGTNGKGSTVSVLESLFREAGYRTGVFTSPHLLRFNERIRVDGEEVSDADIVEAFEAIDRARGAISLTYFEFATLAALLVFQARSPDVLVLEVGLGGRLDAVNIVDPSVAVITSIDLDHQAWLGDTRNAIAREKAGILRAGKPVVVADPDPPEELMRCIEEVGASPALFLGREFAVTIDNEKWRASVVGRDGSVRQLSSVECGSLLPENVCAAVQAVELLDLSVSDSLLRRALDHPGPPARRQLRRVGGAEYVLDVAHNPASVYKLHEYLYATRCNKRILCIFSAMSDKDIRGMVHAAGDIFDAWFLADQPGNPRAAVAADIAAVLQEAGHTMISVSKNLRQAFARAQSVATQGDRLVVFGSFYTVAGIMPLLDKDDTLSEKH
jgi:dihydrofolate synthase/folylpolyglutamate synthase